MPPHRGLYAAALPPIAAAVLASSPYLQTGPVAITGILTLGALSALADPGSDDYVALGLLLALVVGAVRLAFGLLRGGVLAYLMAHPVLIGFTSAAALLIVASQLPTAVGAPAREEGILAAAFRTLAEPGSWDAKVVVLSAGVLVLVLAGGRVHALFPAVPLAIGLAFAYAAATGYAGATVGSISATLPPLTVDYPWGSLPSLLIPGLVIALVGFAEPAAIARTFAALERRPWDPNRELLSQGTANVTAALTGGFPVGGSFSRSALNRRAGARTRWSGAVTGLAVLAFLPFAGVLADLPRAALAAIVIGAVVGLIRIRSLVELWRYPKAQFLVGWITFAVTLAAAPHVEWGVITGVATATAIHLWREFSIDIEAWTDGDTLHLRPLGVLWFATVGRLEVAFVALLTERHEAHTLVVHMGGLGRLDLTGALALKGLIEDAEQAGLSVRLDDVQPRAQRLLSSILAREAQ